MTYSNLTRRELLAIAASLGIGLTMDQKSWADAPQKPAAWPPPGSGAREMPPRVPKYPLKAARRIYSDAEIAQARANLAKYPAAKAVSEKIAKAAAPWLEFPDADLLSLLAPASVPRAFDLNSSKGCPKCGKAIYKFGTYPWIIDPKKPFKIKCPVDGSVYPSNDYDAYYRSGFQDKVGWDTEYVDDGWGWLSPSGERYWFVAHANHQIYHNFIGGAVQNLAHAYTLTGDRAAAHKAAVMIYRLAQIYPEMDYQHQSRYGLMMAAQGREYLGKVLNNIWETSFAGGFADAYDAVWETIDTDSALQKLAGKTGPELRGFIEANFLEDAVDAYYSGEIRGNFGMHQRALCYIALARQYGDQDKWLGGLLTDKSGSSQYLGIDYALYDLIYREGLPDESSPGYNFLWVETLTEVANLMRKSGRDLFAQPRMKHLYDSVLDLITTRKFTPDLGDAGTVYGGMEGRSADVYQTAYRIYQDPRYADFLASFGATGDGGYQTYGSLFLPPIDVKSSDLPALKSRLLDGYAMGFLNNHRDTISAALTYSLKAGHGHEDRLSFEMFAAGQPIMPDLGYPDAMNAFVSGIYTWSKNTISHNTVVVDAMRQPGSVHGTVKLFADSPFARVLDVDAAGTYPQAKTYRRAMVMVDVGDDQSYYLDIFDVVGGDQHDYSLHGPPGEFSMRGGTWSDPAPGTLAGPNVALGEIYDNAALGKPGYSGGYGGYAGSGFQHLFNVQTCSGGDWTADWKHEKDHNSRLRIRTLGQPGQTVMMCDAHVSPVKYPQILKYLIARRAGKNISSRFVSVLEPFHKDPLLESARQITPTEGAGVAVAVSRLDGLTDFIVYNPTGAAMRFDTGHGELATDAQSAVVTLDKSGAAKRVFFAGGNTLTINGETRNADPAPTGKVTSVDPERGIIRIQPDPESARADIKALESAEGCFASPNRHAAHRIASAASEGGEWILTVADDLRIARVPVKAITGATIESAISLPLAPLYAGAHLTGGDYATYHSVAAASGSAITLAALLPKDGGGIAPGADSWIISIGPGDRLETPRVYYG